MDLQSVTEQLTQILDGQTITEMKHLLLEQYAMLRQVLPKPLYVEKVLTAMQISFSTINSTAIIDTVQQIV